MELLHFALCGNAVVMQLLNKLSVVFMC